MELVQLGVQFGVIPKNIQNLLFFRLEDLAVVDLCFEGAFTYCKICELAAWVTLVCWVRFLLRVNIVFVLFQVVRYVNAQSPHHPVNLYAAEGSVNSVGLKIHWPDVTSAPVPRSQRQ